MFSITLLLSAPHIHSPVPVFLHIGLQTTMHCEWTFFSHTDFCILFFSIDISFTYYAHANSHARTHTNLPTSSVVTFIHLFTDSLPCYSSTSRFSTVSTNHILFSMGLTHITILLLPMKRKVDKAIRQMRKVDENGNVVTDVWSAEPNAMECAEIYNTAWQQLSWLRPYR